MADKRKFQQSLASQSSAKFIKTTIECKDLIAGSIVFWHRDFGEWLAEKFKDPVARGQFATHAAAVFDAAGDRRFDRPESADAWIVLQEHHGPDSVIALVQAYSDQTHLDMKGTTCWPMKVTLLNQHREVSIQTHVGTACASATDR